MLHLELKINFPTASLSGSFIWMGNCLSVDLCSVTVCPMSWRQPGHRRVRRTPVRRHHLCLWVCSLIRATLWSFIHGNRFTWQMINKCRCLDCGSFFLPQQRMSVCLLFVSHSIPGDWCFCVLATSVLYQRCSRHYCTHLGVLFFGKQLCTLGTIGEKL